MNLRKDRFRLSYPHKAFTLVELLVVVAVLALLASIVFSNLSGAREQAKISNALSFQSNTHNLLGADLVGWWNFDEGSGSVAKDSSGYGNDGTIVGATRVDGVPGTGGKALGFNGSGNYVQILTNEFPIGRKERTVAAWIKTSNGGGSRGIILSYGSDVDGGIFNFEINHWQGGQGTFGVHFYNSAIWTKDKVIEDGNWYHLIVTIPENARDNNALLYLNGEKMNTLSYNSDIEINTQDSNVQIAKRITGSQYFNGLIDDVRVYSRAITAQEVQTLYAQTKSRYLSEKVN
jgi:prepilin-type N-terminal cleavage/methylation domain-containing protein